MCVWGLKIKMGLQYEMSLSFPFSLFSSKIVKEVENSILNQTL